VQHTLSQAGEASAERAWNRYADLDAWSRWAPFIAAVEAPERALAVGLTGTVVSVGGLRVGFEVLAVDAAARTWRWRARLGPLALVLDHEVTERATGGCVALLTVSGTAPVVLAYLAPAQLALRALVRQ
jgi:hypothetical protein